MSLTGSFSPIGDKSVSHRIALFSILAEGKCQITNFSTGEDCHSSLQAVKKLGGNINIDQQNITRINLTGLRGYTSINDLTEIDCGNSGTTIRLLMGILAGINTSKFVLNGDKYLQKRPMERIASPLRKMGANIITQADRPPVEIISTRLTGIKFTLPVASAQLKSAILLAGLQADTPTEIIEPVPSRDHTELMLKSFGADISRSGQNIILHPGNLNLPENFYVPGDPSSAAFFLTAAALIPGSDVTAKGILLNPTRIHFLKILERMGAAITITEQNKMPESWGDVQVRYNGRLKAANITADEIPLLVDEIPILSLAASLADGVSTYHGVNELRIKETDRVKAIEEELGAYNVKISSTCKQKADKLIINGTENLTPPLKAADSRGDHRMAMTLRLAQLITGQDGTINNEKCAAVSYPNFLKDLEKLLNVH